MACERVLNIVNIGFAGITQHISKKIHIENMKLKFNVEPGQKKMVFGGKRQLFQTLLLQKKFTLNNNKAGYVLNEALGPYFRKEMLKDVDIDKYFTVLFDETTNAAGSKELQICLRYCSISTGLIVTSHLETFFISYATAVILVEKIKESLDNAGLPLSKVIMLGMDGPNVNKTVFRLLNEDIQKLRGEGLLNMGSCKIHTIHNGFLKALQVFGHELGDLITQVKII